MRIACLILVCVLIAGNPATAADPAAAAREFRLHLSAAEIAATFRAQDDADRTAARLTPGRRGGLALRHMKPEARAEALAFLGALFSARGMAVIQGVFDREARLAVIEEAPEYRHPEHYYLAVFGEPGGDRWAVRFEGHHLSLNLSLAGGTLTAVTPFMLGANPRKGPAEGSDPLGAFLSSHENAPALLNEIAGMFADSAQAARLLEGAAIETGGFGVWGHPHFEVTGPRDFGRQR